MINFIRRIFFPARVKNEKLELRIRSLELVIGSETDLGLLFRRVLVLECRPTRQITCMDTLRALRALLYPDGLVKIEVCTKLCVNYHPPNPVICLPLWEVSLCAPNFAVVEGWGALPKRSIDCLLRGEGFVLLGGDDDTEFWGKRKAELSTTPTDGARNDSRGASVNEPVVGSANIPLTHRLGGRGV